MNQLQSELKKFLAVFEPYVRHYYLAKIKDGAKYQSLIANFYKELEIFGSGGKAMRPFLVYLGYKVGLGRDSEDNKKILSVCLAVELAHNFLLIHDDIIDNSETRRGKPTIHKKLGGRNNHYGVSQAIIIADVAAFEAVRLLNQSDFNADARSEAIDLLTEVILETAYGEALDVEYSYSKADIDKVWLVTELKTAKYSFVGPLKLGALLAGAKKSQIKALEDYGLRLGKAFQLQDDILGVFGDEKTIGKSPLSDMREGKNTMLIHKARQMADKETLARIENIWGRRKSTASDLASIRKILESTGALSWCQAENQKLAAITKSEIAKITADKNLQAIFAQIAGFVITREK